MFVLAGCGGDSSSKASNALVAAIASAPAASPDGTTCYTLIGDTAASDSSGGPVSFFPARGATLVTNYRVLNDPKSAGLCYANYRRALVGLPPLESKELLARAAQNHTNYIVLNQQVGHYEDPGRPGYTGATPNDRIQAAYPTNATGEVIAERQQWTSVPNATLALPSNDALVSDLIDAPFHRMWLLGNFAVAGTGYAQQTAQTAQGGTSAAFYQTVDMADAIAPGGDTQLLAYPYAGQADVPSSWSYTESPNPVPGHAGQTLGYPISVQAMNRNLVLDVNTFRLTDSSGRDVPCLRVDHNTEGLSSELQGATICTPLAPLSATTKYVVELSGHLNGKSFDLTWSFFTR